MDKVKTYAVLLCGVAGAMWGKLGALAPLIAALLIFNIADWITGSAASAIEGKGISSDAGRRGIVKKVGYWIEIGVCLVVDMLLIYALPELSIGTTVVAFTHPIVAPMVCCWLDLNEILSIIENLGRMGVPVPEWLAKFITVLKTGVDNAGEKLTENEQKNS